MLAQLAKLEANYPGGLAAYIQSARNLLGQSVRGENPLQGWSPSVPDDGFDLTPGSDEFARHEERGLAEAAHMAFAVPAGGLGERLGFSGVKFALPAEISTGATVLQVYVDYILAVQRHAEAKGGGRCRLPLAIMVSDDTAAGIQRLLEANDHFGLEPAQVTLLKQEKVAALADSDARLALKGPFEVGSLSLSLTLTLTLTLTPHPHPHPPRWRPSRTGTATSTSCCIRAARRSGGRPRVASGSTSSRTRAPSTSRTSSPPSASRPRAARPSTWSPCRAS